MTTNNNHTQNEVPTDPHRWRRVHDLAARKNIRRSVFALNLTAMIDVVFLLLLYFLLSMDFSRAEQSLPATVPGLAAQTEEQTADPFELPRQPILITVTTTEPITPTDPASTGRYAIAADVPFLRNTPGSRLPERLAALYDDVLPPDQPFVIRPDHNTNWQHTLDTLAALSDAGFTAVRLATPTPR